MRYRKHLVIWLMALVVIVAASFAITALAIVGDGLSDHLAKADVAVILGNQILASGRPSARLQARLDRGLELYRKGWAKCVIVSGGRGREGFEEAVVMRDDLARRGVPPGKIILDRDGIDTWHTARNTARIMKERGLKSAVVVTQYFHISRSRLALRRFGVAPVYSAHARYFELRDLYSTAREVLGYVYYRFRRDT